MDLKFVKGQEHVKRALEIAFAGLHPIVLIGFPGSGKTMLKHGFRRIVNFSSKKVDITKDEYTTDVPDVSEYWPCPCGNYGNTIDVCICTADQINSHYQNIYSHEKGSQIFIKLSPVSADKLFLKEEGEESKVIFERILYVRKIQEKRFEKLQDKGIFFNSQIPDNLFFKYLKISDDGKALLRRAINSLGINPRTYANILRIVRTIADLDNLDNKKEIMTAHVAEAIQYSWFKK